MLSHGAFVQGGFTPLTVKWADPNLNEKKRKAAEDAMDPNRDNTQVQLPLSIALLSDPVMMLPKMIMHVLSQKRKARFRSLHPSISTEDPRNLPS